MAKEDFYQEADDEITFNIINNDVVSRLKRDGQISVPEKKISVPKDERWNAKQMMSKILQGLQAGSSVDDMAEAMKSVIGNNQASAIRNTRTMVTSAENNGRLDSYNNLASQGVVMKKEWIATPDDRTRPTHLAIDGEQIDLDEVFSNGCRFPGDSKGPAEEVWMCRCAMGTHIIGFRRADGSISRVDYNRDETLHDKQMKVEKNKRNVKPNAKKTSVEEQIAAIHQYQQVSFEGITKEEKNAMIDYINNNPDVTERVSRGMQINQSVIDEWIKNGELELNDMSSWSADGSVSSRFADVSRKVDAEDGMRSVIIVSENGLPDSALLPRTNAYSESEILTLTKDFEIINYRIQQTLIGSGNASPTQTIIFVKPKRRQLNAKR